MSGVDTKAVQRKAIEKLQAGKELFNNAKDKKTMKEGYESFYEGIKILTQLQQYEKGNATAFKLIGDRIKEYITDLKKMKGLIDDCKLPEDRNAPAPGGGGKGKSGGNVGGNGGGNGGGDGGKEDDPDDEGAKFRNMLSEAIVMEKPDVTWDDVAGLETAKNTLKEAILLPRKFPDIFVGLREPWKGILLYGPPGTGKTFLAKACASMADATFFSISSSDLISKWVGESEKLIKALFEVAREKAPSIVFIDEIDSVVSARSDGESEATRRVKTEFLVQMQGVGKSNPGSILVLGATNFPWGLDPAMRRRFEKRVYIPLPDSPAIEYKINHALKKIDHNVTLAQVSDIVKKLDGYSMSDITNYMNGACYEPLNKTMGATHFRQETRNGKPAYIACSSTEPGAAKMNVMNIPGDQIFPPQLTYEDLINGLVKAKKSVSQESLAKQEEFTRDFGMEG